MAARWSGNHSPGAAGSVPYGVVAVAGPVAVGVGVATGGSGVVAPPGVGAVVCPGTAVDGAAGCAGAVVLAVGVVGVTAGGGVMTAGGAVWTTAVGVVPAGTSSSLVSLTNANASRAPAIATIAPIATVGSCQFGVGASRVRAGAPHSRHQSCSGAIGDEQRGQRIEPGSGSC